MDLGKLSREGLIEKMEKNNALARSSLAFAERDLKSAEHSFASRDFYEERETVTESEAKRAMENAGKFIEAIRKEIEGAKR